MEPNQDHSLDDILATMQTNEGRLLFLRKIYVPGNTAVAERFLAIDPNRDVIEREITYAREHGDTERLRDGTTIDNTFFQQRVVAFTSI
jgi:hypothetical protein